MSEFSGKSFGARKQVAVANNAGANSGAKSEHYEIVETGGGSIGHFTDCSGIGVIAYHNVQTESHFNHIGKRNR